MDNEKAMCSFAGCNRVVKCKRLCTGHYKQMRAGRKLAPLMYKPSPSDDDETRLKVRTEASDSGCLIFVGTINQAGYGTVTTSEGREYAHRAAYRLSGREIPDGMLINHLCGTPPCVNPEHLEAVTARENAEYRTRMQSNNTSGYRCVYKYPYGPGWSAQTQRGGVLKRWGVFPTPEEAAAAIPWDGMHRGGGPARAAFREES